MRILARVNLALPAHAAGAELYLHSLLREMTRRGHECVVAARSARTETLLDGVAIVPPSRVGGFPAPDVVIGYLDDHLAARSLADVSGAPFVTIAHNHRDPQIHGSRPENTALVVWNSEWTRDAAYLDQAAPVDSLRFGRREIVARPPVDAADYASPRPRWATRSKGFVTLVNLQPEKGVRHAVELAQRMPRQAFLFVVGAYGRQERPTLPNATVMEPVAWNRMRSDVYDATSVLLMPSIYESFGRCAVEAACGGVPTIAHPTGGLVEALGDAGIYAHRDNIDEWLRVLDCLEDRDSYTHHSAAARERAAALDPAATYDALEAALVEAAT